jgi:hypothetical protein
VLVRRSEKRQRRKAGLLLLLWPAVLLTAVASVACRQDVPVPDVAGLPTVVAPYPPPVTEASAYPPAGPPTAVLTPVDTYPAPAATLTPTPDDRIFLPVVGAGEEATSTPTATMTPAPTNTATPSPTPTPTIDFAAVRAQLQASGQDLAFAKIGFHSGVGGNRTGLGEWMHTLDRAGVPFFLKSVDDSGPLVEAQELMRNSGVPHVLVYRRSGDEYDTPNYRLTPAAAAREHWQRHRAVFPPELDPSLIWLETINEVDKNRSEWLAQFALETAHLALAEGFRWAAFGWSSGEPEPHQWQSPAMLQFLRLAGANPERLAIALHEYSYLTSDIGHDYPYKVGRFQQLFQIADRHGIPRPTVLITEWGWTYQHVPPIDDALQDIAWASALYAPYPEVKGAAIWYLGGGFGGIAEEAQRLIRPLTHYNLGHYFVVPLPPERAPINPELHRP